MVCAKRKFLSLGSQIAGKFIFDTLLIAEAQLAHRLSSPATIFLGTLEFHGEFYEIEFYNSFQD